MLMENTIIILGFVLFTKAIFEKFGIWQIIETKGAKSKYLFLYKLSQCNFCLTFHLCWITTLIFGAIFGFKTELLSVPFVVSGLLTLKK